MLVAGGIGVTPLPSVLEELQLGGVPEGAPLRRVILLWSARSSKTFGMFADTMARKSERFSLDLRLHLTRGDAPEAVWACFARDGEAPTEAERSIYRYVWRKTSVLGCVIPTCGKITQPLLLLQVAAAGPARHAGRAGGSGVRREQRLRDGVRPGVALAQRKRGRYGIRLHVPSGDF